MIGFDFPRRAVVATGVAALLSFAVPPSHAHAESAEIVAATVHGGQVRLSLSVSGATERLDPASVSLDVDGVVVPGVVESANATDRPLRKTVMLVIDTSGSMAGPALSAARHAALKLLRRLPTDVRVGLVSFADVPKLVVPPTSHRPVVANGVSSLRAGGETALLDGIAVALRSVGKVGLRQLVVLSDGADTTSTRSAGVLTSQLATSGATLDAIVLRTSDAGRSALSRLAATGDGQVTSVAHVTGLAAAFIAAVRPVHQHVVVTATLPHHLSGRIPVTVKLHNAGSEPIVAATTVYVPGHIPTVVDRADPAPDPAPSSSRTLVMGLGALALALFLLVIGGVNWVRPAVQARRRARVLAEYGLADRKATVASNGGSRSIVQTAVDLAGRAARRPGRDKALALELDRAGTNLAPAEFLAIRVGLAIFGGFLGAVLVKNVLATLLLGALLGYLLPRMWLSRRTGRRRAKFVEQLPDALQLVASSLTAGYSLPQALDSLVQQGLEPVSGEIGRALEETRLGVSVEDALDSVAVRLADRDFEWTVMAIRIQREVGGNLAEVLMTVADTLRERAGLRRQVRVLSAEGRLSAFILCGLPVFLALFEFTFRRAYMHPLYSTRPGVGMLVFAIVLMVTGAFWMRKVVKVEV